MKDLAEIRLSARSKAVVLDAMLKGGAAVDYYTAAPVVAELFGKSAAAFRDALTHNPDAPRSCVSRLTDCIQSGIASEGGENVLADCIVQAVIVEVAINELHLKDKFNALLDDDKRKEVAL